MDISNNYYFNTNEEKKISRPRRSASIGGSTRVKIVKPK